MYLLLKKGVLQLSLPINRFFTKLQYTLPHSVAIQYLLALWSYLLFKALSLLAWVDGTVLHLAAQYGHTSAVELFLGKR